MLKKFFKKIYQETKAYIVDSWFFLLTLLVIFVVMTYQLPYYIDTGGGTIAIDDRIQIENETESEGSFNMAYVSEVRATVPTYLLSYVFNTWERVKIVDTKIDPTETQEDVEIRDHLYLDTANQTAIQLAYQKAGKEFHITDQKTRIVYVAQGAITDLQVGDTILSIDGEDVSNFDSLTSIVNAKNVGDVLSLQVLRNEEQVSATATIQGTEENKIIGITLMQKYEYETNPEITLSFLASESGPSGGLLLSLAIYDKLIDEDLTKGYKIVGTGTIGADGSVGAIGGVTYKLRGAVNSKADLFIVPAGENYEDAMAFKEEKGYDIDIIGVRTFDEAVEALRNYQG